MNTSHEIEWKLRQGNLVHGRNEMKEWAGNELRDLMPDGLVQELKVIRLVEVGSPAETIADVALKIGADLNDSWNA